MSLTLPLRALLVFALVLRVSDTNNPGTFRAMRNLPAVPLNVDLEKMMLPNSEKVAVTLETLLRY